MINGKSHRSTRIGGSDFKKECVIINSINRFIMKKKVTFLNAALAAQYLTTSPLLSWTVKITGIVLNCAAIDAFVGEHVA